MQSNKEMVEWLAGAGFADAKVADAMLGVDRALFVPRELANKAYDDTPLPIGFGQTISAPGIVAVMSKELGVKRGMKILEIGAGSGYQAAVLAELVGEKGKIISIERIPGVAGLARANLGKLKHHNIEIIIADGSKGYPEEAPFDRIIVTAAAPEIPPPLAGQLKEGGRLIVPVGSAYWQDLVLVEKKNGAALRRSLLPVVFVPLIGEHGFKG